MATILIVLLGITPSAMGQTAIDANDRGWYSNAGTHIPTNNNTYTGQYNGSFYHSYYRFSIPATFTCVQSATLELELENYYGNGTPHTINLSDVDAVNIPLLDTTNGSGSGAAIYTDLSGGSTYGSQTGLTSANIGDILLFNLPATALTDIESSAGSDFAVGGAMTTTNPGTFWGLRFSAGNENRVHRLTVTVCPLVPDLKASKDVEIYDPSNLGLYGLPGNDAIYTISVTNEGTGSVDNDSMILIDAIPVATTFYNGDIDDGGPETNPVAFSDSESSLSFNYATDVAFGNGAAAPATFADCTYTPISGYDPNVTFICINPKGAMASGTPDPSFSVQFRVQIK